MAVRAPTRRAFASPSETEPGSLTPLSLRVVNGESTGPNFHGFAADATIDFDIGILAPSIFSQMTQLRISAEDTDVRSKNVAQLEMDASGTAM